jgi:alcohol dehydrogenase (cytochrome c)
LYMATLDAHLVALDATDGHPVWKTKVAEASAGYSMTLAPLAIKDKVLVGVAGGEYGIRGFIAAYDAVSGREIWKTYTIPAPGEPGHDSWPRNNDAWSHGGAPVWLTGSYDPALNLTFWGTGNPGPDWNPAQREGDNLYSNCVLALNADTGKLAWHFQFTPADIHDYDAVQIPVLVDAQWNTSTPRKLMYWANRNGFFYVLDRATGEFLLAEPFIKGINWASGIDRSGRPIRNVLPPTVPVFPGLTGATNWYSPSFSPRTGLFYLSVWEGYSSQFTPQHQIYKEGQTFMGGKVQTGVPHQRRSPVNTWAEAGRGAFVALDPKTGQRKWSFAMTDVATSGVVSTASDLVFAGGREGFFYAFDARTGAVLWKTPKLGGGIHQAPITYAVGGKQYIATAAGNSLFVFGLR